ncbi:pheromone A receptor-domain-containing protein [Amylostereum chailletii]|nr:pheromone A receptor-domain-containing protein [Amylostereum chailletii]
MSWTQVISNRWPAALVVHSTMDPTYPLIPIVNFVSAALVLLTILPRCMQHSWNAGLLMLASWVFIISILRAVNAIVWSNSFEDLAPVFCDISTHLDVGGTVGVSASSLAITRRLYCIARLNTVRSPTERERWKSLIFDLSIGVGLPIIIMGLYYTVQPARYFIFEEYGCNPAVISSWLSILLLTSWTIIFPLISILFYCPKIILRFWNGSAHFNETFRSHPSFTHNQYIRVLAVGFVDIAITLPVGIFLIIVDLKQAPLMAFYPGWSITHIFFGVISLPAEGWKANGGSLAALTFSQWNTVLLSLTIFALFGTTEEAISMYQGAFHRMAGLVGIRLHQLRCSGSDQKRRSPSPTGSDYGSNR